MATGGEPQGGMQGVRGAAKCNLPIVVARLAATIPEGASYQFGGRQADKEITEEGFLVKKQMAIRSRKQMF